MEVVIYFLIFMIGAYIGSFCTLAVHRLPLKEDILYKHSYCPNCNNKLKVIDLIPIFSYLFLKSKCRKCGQKIRIRYFLLEILSGIAVLVFVLSTGFNIRDITYLEIINIVIYIVFITTLIIIAGIDKEKNKLQKNILYFGLCLQVFYIIFITGPNLFNIIAMFTLVSIMILEKNNYHLQVVSVIIYIMFFLQIKITLMSVVILLIIMLLNTKFNNKSSIIFNYIIISFSLLIIDNFIKTLN